MSMQVHGLRVAGMVGCACLWSGAGFRAGAEDGLPTRPLWTAESPVRVEPAPFTPLRTLHVSPFGDDTADGLSPDRAFRTISGAAQVVEPGDLVRVRGGEYFENVHLTRPGTEEHPIVFRAEPGETAVITFGRRVPEWARVPGMEAVWQAPYTTAAHRVVDGRTRIRYATVQDLGTVEALPGSFLFDVQEQRLYVHAVDGLPAAEADIRVIDYTAAPGVGAEPERGGYAHDKGLWLRAPWNRVEGFVVEYQPIGVQVRAPHCEVWHVTAIGCGSGVTVFEGEGVTLAHNRAYLNDRSGIHVSTRAEGVRVIANQSFHNTPRGPLTHSDSGGHPHDIALYGAVPDPTFIGNIAVALNPSRAWRFKSARGVVEARRNLVWGGSAHVNYGDRAVYAGNAAYGGTWRVRTPPAYGEVAPGNEQGKAEISGNLYVARLAEAVDIGLADPGRYDFRPREDYRHPGQGPWDEPARLRYVSPDGDDSQDGRIPARARRSLAAAASAVEPGETLYVLPGVYPGNVRVAARGTPEAPIRIRTWGRGRVVVDGAFTIAGAAHVELDGFVLRGALTIEDSEAVTLVENVVDTADTAIAVRRSRGVVIENQTLAGAAVGLELVEAAGRVVVRNSLFYRVARPLEAGAAERGHLLSERNGFVPPPGGDDEAAAWSARLAEGHPSRLLDVELDREYRPPRGHAIGTSGLGHRPIGARGPVRDTRPVPIEDFRVAAALPGEAVLAWRTPRNYADARVEWTVAGAAGGAVRVRQDPLSKDTRQTAELQGLPPGVDLVARLTVETEDGRRGRAEMTFRVPESVRPPTTLYVAPDGDDGHDGFSPATALRTLAAAGFALRPGDTLIVAPGVYPETLRVAVGGLSPEQPLTVRSAVPGEAIIDCGELRSTAVQISGARHVVLSGFRIRGLTYSSIRNAVRVEQSRDVLIERMVFEPRQTGARGVSQQLLVLHGCSDVRIRDNIFYAGFTTIWGTRCDRVRVEHNTFYLAGINAVYLSGEPDARFAVTHNIFEDVTASAKRHAAVKIEHRNEHVVCDYNLHFYRNSTDQHTYGFGHPFRATYDQDARTLDDARERYGLGRHSRFGDPGFLDPMAGDFRLGEDSAARGMGRDGGTVGARYPVEAFSR